MINIRIIRPEIYWAALVNITTAILTVLHLTTENETPMKAKKQASEETPLNDDNHGKRIMNYDLRVRIWNIRTLNRDGASARLTSPPCRKSGG